MLDFQDTSGVMFPYVAGPELQIRGGIKDNSNIIFLIYKNML